MMKNLPTSLLLQTKAISLRDFRITESIIQLNHSSNKSFIKFDGAAGTIKSMTLQNSTFYNIVKNSSAYFIRYNNASNAQPSKTFGSAESTATHTISNCTLAKIFTGKDFANNMLNNGVFTQRMEYCVFYDVYRLYQYLTNNSKRYTNYNYIYYNEASPQSNDYGGRKDSNGNPYATLEEQGFADPLVELDLTQKNGGVNFTPQGAGAVSNKSGDPRWYE
jgi:hypothetical protein